MVVGCGTKQRRVLETIRQDRVRHVEDRILAVHAAARLRHVGYDALTAPYFKMALRLAVKDHVAIRPLEMGVSPRLGGRNGP